MPATTKPPRCLELRINSVTDAKAIVQHQAAIFLDFKQTRSEAIEFIVAKEVDKETAPFIDRLFRVKTFKNVIEAKNGNVLGEIPHLLAPRPKVNPIPPVPAVRAIQPGPIEQPRVKRKYTRRAVKA